MVKNYTKASNIMYYAVLFCIACAHMTAFCDIRKGRVRCVDKGKSLDALIEANIMGIYSAIDNYKIALYASDDVIKSGLSRDRNQEAQWLSLLACAHDYIENEFKKNPQSTKLKLYNMYIDELEEIDAFLRANINDLHERYKQSILSNKNYLTKNYLMVASNDVKEKIEKVKKYFNQAYFNLVAIYPSEKSDLKTVFPGYESFFKTFETWKRSEKDHASKITLEKILAFLNYANVLYIPKNELGTAKGQEKAQIFFDKLGKFAFKLQEQIINQQKKAQNSWFFKKDEEEKLKKIIALNTPLISSSKEIMQAVLYAYLSNPIPRDFNFNRIYKTHDAASLILFAEAGSLQGVLQALLRSITEHMK